MFDYSNMGKAIMPIQIWIYAHDYVYAIHSLSNHALLVCISPTFPDPIVFWRSPDWAKRAQVSVLKKKKIATRSHFEFFIISVISEKEILEGRRMLQSPLHQNLLA